MDTNAAAQDLRNKREQEVLQLKKIVDDEVKAHESALQEIRHKYSTQAEQVNEQLDQAKKVSVLSTFASSGCLGIYFLQYGLYYIR